MLLILINSIIVMIIPMIVMKLSIFLSKKMKTDNEKMSPFECGFNPIFSARIPFSLRFFLITIIFLIFDIEIALFLPMIMTFFTSNLKLWIITFILFVVILVVGIYYEWFKGALDWN